MERCALYLRISREDGEGESQSISSQRLLLADYCAKNNMEITGIYQDDGYTGTNFERPGFLRLLADIEQGKIDTVLTKDLSRLGRDYILTGHYLERYFPQHNVRYLALGDGIDTGQGPDDLTPFRAVVNDLYARDISRKVRASLGAKKQAGQFIGARPPYGYGRHPQDKNKLVIDKATAPVVEQIFALALAQKGPGEIAQALDARGIPPPAGKAGGKWSGAMVSRILKNPTYRGDLTQNRARKISYKVEKSKALPPQQWITVENTHPAIISPQLFAAVEGLGRGRGSRSHSLAGLAHCALCGNPMTFTSDGPRHYLVCTGRRRGSGCPNPAHREEGVEQALMAALRGQIARANPKGVADALGALGGRIPPQPMAALGALLEDKACWARALPMAVARVSLGPEGARVTWRWSQQPE